LLSPTNQQNISRVHRLTCRKHCSNFRGLKQNTYRISRGYPIKGTVPRDFRLHESVSPKHLSLPLQSFQIFSKICGDIRGSRCTTGKNGKIFNQKNLTYFVWTPLGSRVKIYTNFCILVHFKESAAWYCSIFCYWCRWHRWQICRRSLWYRWQFATGGKFDLRISLRIFEKIRWGNWFMKKNRRQKSRDTVPLN